MARSQLRTSAGRDGGGGRKCGWPGPSGMNDASGCHTAGRCTMSQPSTTSLSSSASATHYETARELSVSPYEKEALHHSFHAACHMHGLKIKVSS